MGKALGSGISSAAKGVQAAIKGIATALGAATAAGMGMFAIVAKESSDAKRVLQDAARLNMDTTSFQAYTYAAQKFNIENEKAADILKDVNDKLGDFIMTGGGEAKDIFEQLSLDAQDFIGLAPDQALQKIANAAQGLSAQDKTFLFEAIADDASLLLPLLDENGKKMRELKDAAMQKGMILSPDELRYLQEFKAGLDSIWETIKAFASHVAAYLSAPLKVLLDEVNALIDGFGGMDNAAMAFSEMLVHGLGFVAEAAADVYAWFKKWELKLLTVREAVLAVIQWLHKAGSLLNALLPDSIAIDDETIKIQEQVLRDMRNELAAERVQTEQSIAKAQQMAQKMATDISDKMLNSIAKARADLAKNRANGYAATHHSDSKRSLAEYTARQEKAAEEAAAKAAQQAAKEQAQAAKKLSDAGDKLNGTHEVSTIEQAYAPYKKLAEEYQASLEKAARARLSGAGSQINPATQTAESRKNGGDFERLGSNFDRAREAVKQELQQQAQQYIETLKEASAGLNAAQAQGNTELAAAYKASADAVLSLHKETQDRLAALDVRPSAAVTADNAVQQTAVQAANKQAQAAEQQMQAAQALTQSAAKINVPQVAASKTVELKLSGGVNVNVSGSNESIAQGVVSSAAFVEKFRTLFETQLTASLQKIASAAA